MYGILHTWSQILMFLPIEQVVMGLILAQSSSFSRLSLLSMNIYSLCCTMWLIIPEKLRLSESAIGERALRSSGGGGNETGARGGALAAGLTLPEGRKRRQLSDEELEVRRKKVCLSGTGKFSICLCMDDYLWCSACIVFSVYCLWLHVLLHQHLVQYMYWIPFALLPLVCTYVHTSIGWYVIALYRELSWRQRERNLEKNRSRGSWKRRGKRGYLLCL